MESSPKPLEPVGRDIWIQRHPLRILGCPFGRTVTLLRLGSGQQIVHSTAPFTAEDRKTILELGSPGWIAEATRFHDTFTAAGSESFPACPLLVPPGFSNRAKPAGPLHPPPPEWQGEVEVVELEGMPAVREHAFYHFPSKTLVLADLLFHLPAVSGLPAHLVLRGIAGIRSHPGMSRFFRLAIRDKDAFRRSMARLLEFDLETIIVAHGDPIRDEPGKTLERILVKHDLLPRD